MKLSLGFMVMTAALGLALSESISHQHFISTNNEILSAFTWAALDEKMVFPSWDSAHLNQNITQHLSEEQITAISTKSRKRRTIVLKATEQLYNDLEIKFIIPLFQVYESTFIKFEMPINFKTPFPFLNVNRGRNWKDSYGPMINRMEDLVSLLGVDGKACIKRSICEVAAAPSPSLHGIIGEIVHIFMRHMIEEGIENDTEENDIDIDGKIVSISKGDYVKAGQRGKEKGDCWEAYSECPVSLFNLVNEQ